MTETDSLIDRLAQDGARQRNARRGFVMPLLAAIAICIVGVTVALDGAFDPVALHGVMPLTVKWWFSATLTLLSASALWLLGKPGRKPAAALWSFMIPFVFVVGLLLMELAKVGPVLNGPTWRTCLLAMAIMSPIGFAGAILATRYLAPTDLRRTGGIAGLFGGAVAMAVYSPYCPERGALFMAVFYCLPILAMAGLGWLLGPRLLRW